MLVISVSTSLRLLATSWLPAFLRSGPRRLKPGGDQRLVFVGSDLVAGQLLAQEPIVRLVVVEGADDVIAIAPGVLAVRVVLEAVGLGEADDIQPVLAPVLAIVRAGEQALDQFLPGIRRAVGDERLDFGGRRRQAGEVEAETADQRGAGRPAATAGVLPSSGGREQRRRAV